MPAYQDALRDAFEDALAEQRDSYAQYHRSADARAAVDAVKPSGSAYSDALEDAVAVEVSGQYGIPIEDVNIDGSRYGDVLAARRGGAR